jgi:hypothetical protein
MRKKMLRTLWVVVLFFGSFGLSPLAMAQGTPADYERANGMRRMAITNGTTSLSGTCWA